MDGAGVLDLYWAIRAMQARQGLYAPMSRRVMVVGTEALGAAWVKLPLVQILVVVANIQTRTLKTEVEKGSM